MWKFLDFPFLLPDHLCSYSSQGHGWVLQCIGRPRTSSCPFQSIFNDGIAECYLRQSPFENYEWDETSPSWVSSFCQDFRCFHSSPDPWQPKVSCPEVRYCCEHSWYGLSAPWGFTDQSPSLCPQSPISSQRGLSLDHILEQISLCPMDVTMVRRKNLSAKSTPAFCKDRHKLKMFITSSSGGC